MSYLNPSGVKARPLNDFTHIGEISRQFEDHPHQLVSYVERALESGGSVLARHLTQLAAMVNQPLLFQGAEVRLPPLTFVRPGIFQNISQVVEVAHVAFGSSPMQRWA